MLKNVVRYEMMLETVMLSRKKGMMWAMERIGLVAVVLLRNILMYSF